MLLRICLILPFCFIDYSFHFTLYPRIFFFTQRKGERKPVHPFLGLIFENYNGIFPYLYQYVAVVFVCVKKGAIGFQCFVFGILSCQKNKRSMMGDWLYIGPKRFKCTLFQPVGASYDGYDWSPTLLFTGMNTQFGIAYKF